MNNYDFLGLVLKHLPLYLVALGLCLAVYYVIYRRLFISILDPLFLSTLFSLFGSSVVLFLYFTDSISNFYFSSFILTQAAFILGLFWFKPYTADNILVGTLPKSFSFRREGLLLKSLFLVSCFIFVLAQLVVYAKKGIPLFMESRLETFTGGSGFGIFSRFIDIAGICGFYLAIYLIISREVGQMRPFVILFLLFFGMSLILTGSKSAFLLIGFIIYSLIIYNMKYNYNASFLFNYLRTREKKILYYGFLIALLVIIIQSYTNKSHLNAFVSFILRLIHSGDIYWYAYPNSILEKIDNSKPFQALFVDFLGFFRLVSWEDLPTAIGIDLFQYHHPTNVIQGPNGRHNVFGLIYFGYYGAILFSFCIGYLVSYVRNYLYFKLGNNVILGLVYTLLYTKIVAFEADPMLAFTYLCNILVVFPFLFILSTFVYAFLVNIAENEQSAY
jgi:hypothetical protein